MIENDLRRQTGPDIEGLGNPTTCARCAKLGPTCCQCRPGEEELAALVSESERNHMAAIAPWTIGEHFVVQVPNSPPFIDHMIRLFPDRAEEVYQMLPAEGWHYRLHIDKIGQCSLLGPRGCLLPREARPLFCRIYPFWFIGQQLQVFVYDHCLAIQESVTVQELCISMGTSPEQLYELFARLCRAWGFEPSRIPSRVCN